MKNDKLGKRVICGVIAGSMLLAGGIFAYADDTAANSTDAKSTTTSTADFSRKGAHFGFANTQMGGGLKSVLDKMVEEGTLTKEKSDAVQKYIEQKTADMKKMTKEQLQAQKGQKRVSLLDQMVTDGVITANEATAIKDKQKAMMEERRANRPDRTQISMSGGMKTVLDKMVAEGTLTQAKADAVQKYIEQKTADMKKMTKEQLQAQKGQKRVSLLDQMVTDGVITANDATAIRDKQKAMMEEKKAERLKSLVDKGVITDDQLQKVNEYLKAAQQERQQLLEKIKGMTAEERKAYFESNKDSRKDTLQKMVDDGVITQDQAKELRKVIPGAFSGMHKGHFKGDGQQSPKAPAGE